MAKVEFEVPKLTEYTEVPVVTPGTMAHSRPLPTGIASCSCTAGLR